MTITTKDTRLKITIGIVALALGAAVTSAPAFAYDAIPGYNSQGGVVAVPHKHRSLYNKYSRHQYNRTLPKGGNTVE